MSFIRRNDQAVVDTKKMFDGEGQAILRRILNSPEEMFGKGRIFNHMVLKPGCEVGWHVHKGDAETYYVIKGHGEYSDNGSMVTLNTGDMSFVDDGEGHSIKNTGDEDLEFIALILYK